MNRHALYLLLSILLLPPAHAGAQDKGAPAYQGSDLYKFAKTFCEKNNLGIYQYHERYTGNSEGIFAPFIKTKDGGILIVASVGDTQAVVTKFDASRKQVWQKSFKKAGRPNIEGESAAETSDGFFYIATQAYLNPSTAGQIWILKLDQKGNQVWEILFRGTGNDNNPSADRLQLTKTNGIRIKGSIYPTLADIRAEKSHLWGADISAQGKVTFDKVDPPDMPIGEDEIDKRYPW